MLLGGCGNKGDVITGTDRIDKEGQVQDGDIFIPVRKLLFRNRMMHFQMWTRI